MKRGKLLPLAVFALLATTVACTQAPSIPTLGPPDPGTPVNGADRAIAQADDDDDDPGVERRRFPGMRDGRDGPDGRDGIRPPMTTDRRDTDRRRRYRWPWWRYQGYQWPPYGRYAAATVVTIRNYQFLPSTLTVDVGTPVTWVNRDGVAHTSTAPPPGIFTTQGAWDGVMGPGQSYSQTFNVPGRFEYYCRFHPYMRGAVVVRGRYY